jgi:tetratricopeptide (TPR) repeat protein
MTPGTPLQERPRTSAPRLFPAGTSKVSWLIGALLLLGTLAAFSGVTDNDFVSFDDPVYVQMNPVVGRGLTWEGVRWAFTTVQAANWHPLTWLSHMLDVQLFGLDPAAHHGVGLGLHALNALLLFLLFVRLTGAPWRSGLVAALFAVHPLHVESVAWASERKDLLSTALALLALLAWLRHLARPSAARLAAVCALFALALLAKPMPVTLPFLLLLLDWWPLGRWSPGSPSTPWRLLPPFALWREKAPLFALSAASAAVTFYAQRAGGAVVPESHITSTYRIVNSLMGYEAYLEKAVWPTGLSFYYRLPPNLPIWWLAAMLLLLGGAILLLLRAARRRPWLGLGTLWYVGTLVPVIGLVQVGGQSMADRYMYLPLTGIFLMIAWSVAELVERRPAARPFAIAAAVAVLAVFGTLTRAQVAVWRDDFTVSRHSLALDPDNWMAHSVLGIGYMKQQKFAEAKKQFEEALRINPGAEAYFDLGAATAELGKTDEAIALFRQAIAIKPGFLEPHALLGRLLVAKGQTAEAVEQLRTAVQLDPYRPEGYAELAAALGAAGQTDEAVGQYLEALKRDPGRAEFHNELGRLLAASGRYEEAETAFRRMLALDPKSVPAHNNLGNVLLKLGRVEEAVAFYQQALVIDPGSAETHFNLGDAFSAMRKLDEAVRHYELFLAAQPGHAVGTFHLANALAAQGKFTDAIARYRRAIELDPKLADAHFNLGNALMDLGRTAEALESFLQAVRLRPDDADYQARLGDAYARLGRWAEAESAYRSALTAAPSHPVAGPGLARVKIATGRGAAPVAPSR